MFFKQMRVAVGTVRVISMLTVCHQKMDQDANAWKAILGMASPVMVMTKSLTYFHCSNQVQRNDETLSVFLYVK